MDIGGDWEGVVITVVQIYSVGLILNRLLIMNDSGSAEGFLR